ncbi:SDR family oxidoreductase [Hymenobacter lutimineralis]|uniref:dTDP-4-dehydrorhamnose reductase n=1 Tax=Hymenobacter lutimineralis TaxID=2606448 RepID=A0A5D6V3G2_9BACT|nr:MULTISPECIES: SDR family oxidoreductase [Hymenobacter]QIX60951.1 SDR family oxidoreductase [Hymenobacter sp. BT18]TYZ09588.1 SDR family oxidoreductase [Hymenobacter lutimineralis]
MRVLITGSNGLLGQKLIARLHAEEGVELIATSRGANKLAKLYPAVRFVQLDVTDQTQVEQVLMQEQPTHLIHTAAMTNVDECELNQADCWKQNVTAVENLVAVCERQQVHLVHVSTDFIFDGKEGPLTEEAVPAPVNFYGKSKLAAEQAVQRSRGPWAIVRTVLVYGVAHEYGRTNLVLWVRDSLRAQQPIQVVDDQLRTPTLAEDLAQGCWLAALYNASGIYHVSGQEVLTPFQMALRVADFFQLDSRLISRVDASTFSQPAKRPLRTGFIIDKAQRELGYAPHSLEQGMALVAQQAG